MSNSKINEKIISIILKNINNQLYLNIEFYYIKLNELYKKKELELNNMPNKLFKKRYKKWQYNINEINKEINNIYLKIDEEFNFIKKKEK